MLCIKNLNKSFGNHSVLSNINFHISAGEVVCIIGPSGSGKSTLLRCINFLEKPTDGIIEFNGRIVENNHSQLKLLRGEIGMVFQDFNLFETKDVLSNIMLAPILTKKMIKSEAKQEALKVLDFVGLLDKIHSMPQTLSGGEKQRVAIARALITQPKLILMDEPTSALDPELVHEVLKVIKSLAKGNVALIIVTHQIDFVKEVADRVIFMENGVIVEEAITRDFFENPKFERTKVFLKSVL